MARQRFSISFRNTLAQWLKAWAKRLELGAPDAADKDESVDNNAVVGQADEPPAHWLERADRHQQPPAHWLAHPSVRRPAHASVHGRAQVQSYAHLRAPEPPDAELPGIEPSTEPPSTAQMPEPVPLAADKHKHAAPRPRFPLRLIPHTQAVQEEKAKTPKTEAPQTRAEKPSTRKAEEKALRPASPQKRQEQKNLRTTTLRLEPRSKTDRGTNSSEESSPESATILPPTPNHNLEPRQRNERAKPKRAAEPDSQLPKEEDAITPIPQPQPSPADLWPRRPRPKPVSSPGQAPVLEATQWVNLESEYTPATAYTSPTPVVSPDRPPSLKVERRLSERAIEEDNSAVAIFQPRSDSQGENRAWPQKQEEEMDHWPELPGKSLEENVADNTAEDWEIHLRAWQRRQKLDQEQRGILWNESPS